MQKNLNIEKIALKVVQIKFILLIKNVDIITVGNFFMEHDLYLISTKSITTNIALLLMTGFVFQCHMTAYTNQPNKKCDRDLYHKISRKHSSLQTLRLEVGAQVIWLVRVESHFFFANWLWHSISVQQLLLLQYIVRMEGLAVNSKWQKHE